MASRSRARGQPQQFGDYSRAIVETARECLLILNQELQVKAANPAFHQTFRLPPEKTQNRPLFELGNGEWNLPELRSLLNETRTRGVPFEDFEIEREFSGIGRRTVLVSARPVRPGPDSDSLILVTLKDGAERRRTENVQRSMLRAREKLNSTLEPEKLLDDLAREAIELHLEGLIEEGQPVPTPRPIEQSRKDPIYRGGTWAVVSIDPACLRVNAKRINITMPQRILDAVDRHAAAEYETRSGLLTKAAVKYLAEKRPPASTPKRRRRYRRRPS